MLRAVGMWAGIADSAEGTRLEVVDMRVELRAAEVEHCGSW